MRLIDRLFGRRPATPAAVPGRCDDDVAAPAAAPAPHVAEPVEPPEPVAEAPTTPVEPAPPALIDLRPAELRAWARENGIAVSDHGKIPRRVLEAYAARRG